MTEHYALALWFSLGTVQSQTSTQLNWRVSAATSHHEQFVFPSTKTDADQRESLLR